MEVKNIIGIIAISVQIIYANEVPTLWKTATSMMNLNCTSGIIWLESVEHIGVCGQKCMLDPSCHSFGYEFSSTVCQGHVFKRFCDGKNEFQYQDYMNNFVKVAVWYKIDLSGEATNASSVYNWIGKTIVPDNAIDGDINTNFHTKEETNNNTYPFWQVNLNSEMNIVKVVVFKWNVTTFRFFEIYVYVGNSTDSFALCNSLITPNDNIQEEFVCSESIRGDTVKIESRIPMHDYSIPLSGFPFRILELAEVDIYAER